MENNTFTVSVQLEVNNIPDQLDGVLLDHVSDLQATVLITWDYTIIHRNYGIASISPRIVSNQLDLSTFVDNNIHDIDSDINYEEKYGENKEPNYIQHLNDQKKILEKFRLLELSEITCEIEHPESYSRDMGLVPTRLEIDLSKRVGILYFQSNSP